MFHFRTIHLAIGRTLLWLIEPAQAEARAAAMRRESALRYRNAALDEAEAAGWWLERNPGKSWADWKAHRAQQKTDRVAAKAAWRSEIDRLRSIGEAARTAPTSGH